MKKGDWIVASNPVTGVPLRYAFKITEVRDGEFVAASKKRHVISGTPSRILATFKKRKSAQKLCDDLTEYLNEVKRTINQMARDAESAQTFATGSVVTVRGKPVGLVNGGECVATGGEGGTGWVGGKWHKVPSSRVFEAIDEDVDSEYPYRPSGKETVIKVFGGVHGKTKNENAKMCK